MEFDHIIAPIVAIGAALGLTPGIRWLSLRIGLVDAPDNIRRMQRQAIPLGGGMVVWLAALIAVVAATIWGGGQSEAPRELITLALACGLILALGMVDDWIVLRGRQKMLGQFLVIGTLVATGLVIERIQLFGMRIELGLLAIPFTAFWLLGAINSLNLLDGADGFAATIGAILSAAIGVIAILGQHPAEATIAFALSGALLGFLRYNFPPATIYLGDGGSMLIGLCLGVLAIRGSIKAPATVALMAPMALMAIPILDSSAAFVRRALTGRSVYLGDRGHLHHMLLQKMGPRALLLFISLMCGLTAAGALVSAAMHNELYAFASGLAVVGILCATRLFGFNELVLVASRTLSFGNSFVLSAGRAKGAVHQHKVHLQGAGDWDEVWNTLTDFADNHGLTRVKLDIDLPWMHQAYHADWKRKADLDESLHWTARVPLMNEGRACGRLELGGQLADIPPHEMFALLSELLESIAEPILPATSARSQIESASFLAI